MFVFDGILMRPLLVTTADMKNKENGRKNHKYLL